MLFNYLDLIDLVVCATLFCLITIWVIEQLDPSTKD